MSRVRRREAIHEELGEFPYPASHLGCGVRVRIARATEQMSIVVLDHGDAGAGRCDNRLGALETLEEIQIPFFKRCALVRSCYLRRRYG